MKNHSILFVFVLLFVLGSTSHSQNLINIDAEKDEFFKGLTGPNDGYIYLPRQSAQDTTNKMADSNEDLSALAWFAYDELYLYCYGEVTDDTLVLNHPTRPWRSDNFELKIDPLPMPGGSGLYHVRMTALDSIDADEGAVWDNLNEVSSAQPGDWARKRTEDGYVVEFRLLLEAMIVEDRGPVMPFPGYEFGMSINVYDQDGPPAPHQHEVRFYGDDAYNPSSELEAFGTVRLLEGNKVQLIPCSPLTGVCRDSLMYIPPSSSSVDLTGDIEVPREYALSQNYPNPFNPSTTISYSILNAGNVKLSIYDILGKEIQTLVEVYQAAGTYTVKFDVSDLSGGVYFYRLQAGSDFMDTKKMLLLR